MQAAGDWSGRIFAAQGKACDAQLPVDGRAGMIGPARGYLLYFAGVFCQ